MKPKLRRLPSPPPGASFHAAAKKYKRSLWDWLFKKKPQLFGEEDFCSVSAQGLPQDSLEQWEQMYDKEPRDEREYELEAITNHMRRGGYSIDDVKAHEDERKERIIDKICAIMKNEGITLDEISISLLSEHALPKDTDHW